MPGSDEQLARARWTLVRPIAIFGLLWTAAQGLRVNVNLNDVKRYTVELMCQSARSYAQLIEVTRLSVQEHPRTDPMDQATAKLIAENHVSFRIVSANRATPEQTPDQWESNALAAVQKGGVAQFAVADASKAFRYLAPLQM